MPSGEFNSPKELQAALEKTRKEILKGHKTKETLKSPEEIEFIGIVQMVIANERARLGLAPGFYIQLERVRLYHPEAWKSPDQSIGGNRSGRGEYNEELDLVETQTPSKKDVSPYAYFKTLSHELLHQSSYMESDPRNGNVIHKSGYVDFETGKGVGLDEGMTEEINQELLEQNSQMLSERFPEEKIEGKPSRWETDYYSYAGYRVTMRSLAKRIDAALYGGEPTTWDNLKRGYFSDDDIARKDIEKVLGPDAFEMLMLIGNPNLFDLQNAAAELDAEPEQDVMRVINNMIRNYIDNPERNKETPQIIRGLLRKEADSKGMTIKTG